MDKKMQSEHHSAHRRVVEVIARFEHTPRKSLRYLAEGVQCFKIVSKNCLKAPKTETIFDSSA
jgi:hypothetical protein